MTLGTFMNFIKNESWLTTNKQIDKLQLVRKQSFIFLDYHRVEKRNFIGNRNVKNSIG